MTGRPRLAGGLALLLLLGLGACTTPQQQHEADAAACQGYGFAPGSPEMAGCIQREVLARRQARDMSLAYGPCWGPGFGPGLGPGWR